MTVDPPHTELVVLMPSIETALFSVGFPLAIICGAIFRLENSVCAAGLAAARLRARKVVVVVPAGLRIIGEFSRSKQRQLLRLSSERRHVLNLSIGIVPPTVAVSVSSACVVPDTVIVCRTSPISRCRSRALSCSGTICTRSSTFFLNPSRSATGIGAGANALNW